ncbi:hypothetical protein HHI36_016634 [Cryptolaemus montrouzieri]|uniref:Uncharacterized protein n=1 Tax=Cryptolaemus montrouzieri TaxID=559131 RepID=A0ABD2NKC9_9CUCU
MFSRPAKQSKAATIASFKISHILAKHKKPFEDGSVVKETFIEAGETLFGDFKNKTEIMSAIRELQLFRPTVTSRIEVMSQDMANKLKHDIMYVHTLLHGFVALCRANEDFPSYFSFHCIIQQQVLCSKVLNTEEIMGIATKIVNSIRARSLQRRLFML